MKNYIVVFLSVVTFSVHAQKHLVGLQGGLNFANVSATYFPEQGPRTGIIAGFSYEYLVRKHFSVGADILYAQRGFTTKLTFINSSGQITDKNFKSKFNYEYVSIPVKASFKFGNKFYGFGNVGIVPSILVSAIRTLPDLGSGNPTSSMYSNVTKFDLAGIIELGTGYKIENRYWVFASAGFQQSFTTLSNPNYFAADKIYHYGLIISIGVKYSIGVKNVIENSK